MHLSRELRSVIAHLRYAADLPPLRTVDHHPVRWDRWMDLVDEHQLGPFLGARVPHLSELAIATPAAVQNALRARYIRSGLDAAFRSIELGHIVRCLEREVAPVVLKGAGLAHTLYAEAAEREMADVDLLFATPEHALRAQQILREQGYDEYQRAAKPRGPHHHLPPMTNGVAEMTVELHTNLATPPLPTTAIAEMCRMRRAVSFPGSATIHVLDPICCVLHQALHAMADPVESPLLRNLFEIAWLVNGLSRIERSTVRTLARRWGIEDRVACALRLASGLFGAPPVMEKQSPGARELWCLRRLEWADGRERAPGMYARLRRDVARRHLAKLSRGAGRRNPLPLFSSVLGAMFSALKSRVTAHLPRRKGSVEPVTLFTAPVGESMVAHDQRTGCVHLLDGVALSVWSAARAESEPARIESLLRAHGIEERTTRLALEHLVDRGLLRPGARGGSPRVVSP